MQLACFSEQRHAVTLQTWTHLPHPPRVYMLALSSQSEQVTRGTHRRSAPTPAVQGHKVSTQTTPRPSADSAQGTESVRTDLGFPGTVCSFGKRRATQRMNDPRVRGWVSRRSGVMGGAEDRGTGRSELLHVHTAGPKLACNQVILKSQGKSIFMLCV